MMDRRAFIGAAAAFVGASPFAAMAQAARIWRIGFVSNGTNLTTVPSQLESFRRSLSELGWVDGQTVTFEYRWADGNYDRLPTLVAELIQAKVDVILVSGPPAMRAAQKATSTIPVVFLVLADPVAMGFVQSFARPGGNMTGLASQYEELITKQLQLLKEAVPGLSRVALLRHTEGAPAILKAAQAAAPSLGLTVRTLTVGSAAEFESAFKTAHAERVGAVHVLPAPYFGTQRARLIELAARYRLPACYELRHFVQNGGFMFYGPNIDAMFGRAASYIDRILKGANPGELAIERPTKFELVFNLKTAAALGLTIPPSLLQRADELIK